MSVIKSLSVKHTATFKGEPLVIFRELPGADTELTPAQIRALADVLMTIADDCETHARGVRRYADRRREYPVEA